MAEATSRPLATAKPRLSSGANASPADKSKEPDLPYEERELRNRAARVLENEEMLLLLSRQRHESVLQTRIYCEARAAGLKDETLKFDYTMDVSEETNKSSTKSPAAKGTARVVSGSSKTPGSPLNNKRDKDRGRDGGRRSTGSAR
ncbi:unnamed protein product [Aureobasidium uvarum]|uniref:Uncharacterized protein n=1 Tax=Aureobasidium uvarum TaxID=2773716 RepID=A0A9N8KPJ9_9PEZI|nr:unnamed protein product [Aureobasidium uvarum]